MIKYIVFTAGVNAQTMASLRVAVIDALRSGCTEVYILISSGGGDVFEGLSMASLLKSLPIKVTMHNIGQTDSVANVIFAAGDVRHASPNASFLFHGVVITLGQPQLLESQLHESYKTAIRLREDIAKNFSTYSGVALDEVNNLMIDGATILSAEQAQLKGIIHSICEPDIASGADITAIGNV